MENEQYFKCPICGKKELKRKGIKLMYSTICEKCWRTVEYIEIKRKEERK
jgi:ribosomal protein L37AE/L43A